MIERHAIRPHGRREGASLHFGRREGRLPHPKVRVSGLVTTSTSTGDLLCRAFKRHLLGAALTGLAVLASVPAQAQDTIKIANIVEMSGPGTTSGVMFKNGVEMAIKEINAAGGILGKKISYTSEDTQTDPGVAKGLTQKAVDNDVFAIFLAPVYRVRSTESPWQVGRPAMRAAP